MPGRTTTARDRRVPWVLAAVVIATLYAVTIAVTGGFNFQIAGMRVRSRSWVRPALLALAGVAVLVLLIRDRLPAISARVSRVLESSGFATWLAAAAVAWALAAGVWFGTFASGGADSYGYVGQARLLAHGHLTDTIPLSDAYRWPDVEFTLTPLGFTAGRATGVIAPKYPPGLPLLLAPFAAFSERAIYLVVPVFGALLVWTTYRLGAALGDPPAGAMAAALLSASPTFLYQVVQPMSDVPAAACWLGALLLAASGTSSAAAGSGVICSLAILIRPNLAPLAGLIAIAAIFSGPAFRLRRAFLFAAALGPGLVTLGWIQNVRYGSPLASGYGTLSDGFSMRHLLPNLARYPRWLTETHTWFIWLSVAAPLWIVRRAQKPLLAWLAVALAAATWTVYLPYIYFQPNEWFYTRFLLAAIAVMLVFATAVALWPLRRLPVAWRAPATLLLIGGLFVMLVHAAQTHGAFDIRNQEQKYPLAGAFVRDRLPAAAFVLAGQHSGSIRYYANRPTLRWDLLSPVRLDEVLATFRAQGYEPFLVVDAGEYEDFREKFARTDQRAIHQLTPLAVLGDARVFGFR
ncbi:MAG: glycosyltransferase family 39 protein [Acidobacteriota bacterium]|nr:glycosyltransferase family 39 protein [Acidobacteriota bacterium]